LKEKTVLEFLFRCLRSLIVATIFVGDNTLLRNVR